MECHAISTAKNSIGFFVEDGLFSFSPALSSVSVFGSLLPVNPVFHFLLALVTCFFFWCHIWHSAHELSTPILSEHPCFPKSDEQLLFYFSLLPIGLFRSRNDIGRLSKLACAWRLWRITRSTCTHRRASITEWRVTFRGSLLRAHSWPKWRCALQVLKEGICLTCWHLMAVVGKEKISPVHNVASSCTQ